MGGKVSKYIKKNKYKKIQELETLNDSIKNIDLYEKEKKRKLEDLEKYYDKLKKEIEKYKYLLKNVLNENSELCELHNIKSKLECKICMDRNINTFIIPCGHVICNLCINIQECPYCRTPIQDKKTIYF